ncbi:helix-turn-helix transcriptional regulator [Allosphingosinicella flava]|uniref:Helix-turn-helix transcriptional regulator n=1 Tax=Allosphingosinicella flava TaxID=2771430 RepID=A0A7T2GJJ2_9SPHN|nr:helix-turn-helix transcriptional regulator [Sphingosinicella flava]QPQ55034.1 helix-turn-helix transcriptional regulator [Sphingosinicella flava]
MKRISGDKNLTQSSFYSAKAQNPKPGHVGEELEFVANVERAPYLTAREKQVLEWVACGWSSKQIAILCKNAPRTIEAHIANLMRKMSARNRAHLILLAMQCGVLTTAVPPASDCSQCDKKAVERLALTK